MDMQTRRLADLKPAEYNPREKLLPGSPDYERILRSIEDFGYCDPIIINRDGTIIGGNQRAQVLQDIGAETASVVVLDLSKEKEKALCIALNRITGRWDHTKLNEIIGQLDLEEYDLSRTGFSDAELSGILEQVRLRPGDLPEDFTLPDRSQRTTCEMRVTLHREQIALINRAINQVEAEGFGETYGNTNRLGNGLAAIVSEWLEWNTPSEESDGFSEI